MSNLISDFRTAAGIFKDIRQERKNGNEVVVRRSVTLPCISAGAGFYDTVEGCTLTNCGRDIDDIARNAFNTLSFEEKRRFSFAPRDGEFIERVNFWKELLRPVMTPKQHSIAIRAILHWYIHIKHLREEGVIC